MASKERERESEGDREGERKRERFGGRKREREREREREKWSGREIASRESRTHDSSPASRVVLPNLLRFKKHP